VFISEMYKQLFTNKTYNNRLTQVNSREILQVAINKVKLS